MSARRDLVPFAFLGGPLYRLGRGMGLVRGETNTVPLGLALGVGMWIACALLAVIGGALPRFFSLAVIGAHARLLIVIPLFFICESVVAPRMTVFVRRIAEAGVVPPHAASDLNAAVVRANRWADAWWPEAASLVTVAVVAITGENLLGHGDTGAYDPSRTALVAQAYFRVGLAVFQFLAFRWICRLALWVWFLWRVSRLDLHLVPGHPDRAGGLDGVGSVQERFGALVAAISVLACTALAEDLSSGALTFAAVYPFLAVLVLVDAVLFLGPLFVFSRQLWTSRTGGMDAYSGLAERYVAEFERKWLHGGAVAGEPLLGTADLQSLADLGNSVGVVRAMRWVPIGTRLLSALTLAAVVPLSPLLLFRYPVTELAQKFVVRVLGL